MEADGTWMEGGLMGSARNWPPDRTLSRRAPRDVRRFRHRHDFTHEAHGTLGRALTRDQAIAQTWDDLNVAPGNRYKPAQDAYDVIRAVQRPKAGWVVYLRKKRRGSR